MFATENRFQKIIRIIIDIINVVLGIGVVVLAVMAFINTADNKWMFPIIFLMGGGMNLLTGIKFFINDRNSSGIMAIVAAGLLMVISVMSYMAIGGI